MHTLRLRWTCLLTTLLTANLLFLAPGGHFRTRFFWGLRPQAPSLAKLVKREAANLPDEPAGSSSEDRSLNQGDWLQDRDRPDELALLDDEGLDARQAEGKVRAGKARRPGLPAV